MVTYAIEALVSAGVTEILVTGGTHAGEFFRLLGDGHGHGIGLLQYAYQEREGGIADALGLAERFAGDDRVLVMLADNIFERSIKPAIENFERQERGARIVLSKVDEPEHLRHLGVAELDGDKVVRILEKPERAAERVRSHRPLLLRLDRVRVPARRSRPPRAASSRSPT